MSNIIIIPPRTDTPPVIRRDSKHRIIWEPDLVTLIQEESQTGRTSIQTARWLGLNKNSIYDVSKRFAIKWQKPIFRKKPSVADEENNPIHPDRLRAGIEPLPAGHRISWGSISEYRFHG